VREGDEDEDEDDESDDEYMTKTEKLAKIHVCCVGGGGSESLVANFKPGSAPGEWFKMKQFSAPRSLIPTPPVAEGQVNKWQAPPPGVLKTWCEF